MNAVVLTSAGRAPVVEQRRVLVVSHPAVLPVNQAHYARLAELGWEVDLIVPSRWRHEYATSSFRPRALPELEQSMRTLRVVFPGRPQRHVYAARTGRLLRHLRPDVALFEEEYFSLPAAQWGVAAAKLGIPFGVQADENLDRELPLPARLVRSWVLRRAAFVTARSPVAGTLARRHGATGLIPLVPHAVPGWEAKPLRPDRIFTIGFAGRLVVEKGIRDLVEASHRLEAPVRLLFVGDGPLRLELEHSSHNGLSVELVRGLPHERMPEAYARMDVLVLPSRTTARWAEQFGRVLVEALWCGVPVVGSSSGEIPWVIESTGGGQVFPEGDVDALAATLSWLRTRPEERRALATSGRAAVERLFSATAAARALDKVLRAAIDGTGRESKGD
jgi:glycosyltransferase involved in cell wall biosynthesis